MSPKETLGGPYGNLAPFAEPAWYNSLASPYYGESHRRLRDYARKYLNEHIVPHLEEWEEQGHVPDKVRRQYAKSGLGCQSVPPEYSGPLPIHEIVPPQGRSS
jgi:alkylation response protein AidB-like acyl-CoA dehydrogenase